MGAGRNACGGDGEADDRQGIKRAAFEYGNRKRNGDIKLDLNTEALEVATGIEQKHRRQVCLEQQVWH